MKTFVSISIILLSIHGVNAQKGEVSSHGQSSFGFSAGYGLPLGSQYIDVNYTSNLTPTSSYSGAKGVYGSYGSGTYLSAFYTRMFTPSIGLDFGIHYLIGKQYSANDKIPSSGYTYTDARNSSSQGLFFAPSIVLQSGETKLKPYVKAGLVIGTMKLKSDEEETVTATAGGVSGTQIKTEFTGGIPFGFKAGFGVEFKMKNNLMFFTEINFISMSYYPANGEITQYNLDGVDQLGAMTTSQKKMVYKREITYTSAGPDPDQPRPTLQQSIPMGSISLNAGVKFTLNK